jgi:hypothetical protein
MMQDADKGVRRSSSYDPKQATDAVAATSDQAIRQAYIAATLPKDRPSNLDHAENKPTGDTVIDDVGIFEEDFVEEDVVATKGDNPDVDEGAVHEGDDKRRVV